MSTPVADTVQNAVATPEKEQPYAALGLKPDEYDKIREILGRRPTSGELAMYSVMWSEHCSYKSSKIYLRRFGQKVSDEMKERLFRAYFVESLPVGKHETLTQLASELGFDAGEVANMLGSGQYTEAVKTDLAQARANGITGVPFFVFQKKYAVSGAQPAATLLTILQRVAGELPVEPVAAAADQCDDDGCAV